MLTHVNSSPLYARSTVGHEYINVTKFLLSVQWRITEIDRLKNLIRNLGILEIMLSGRFSIDGSGGNPL